MNTETLQERYHFLGRTNEKMKEMKGELVEEVRGLRRWLEKVEREHVHGEGQGGGVEEEMCR
jgi:hypothetical protein